MIHLTINTDGGSRGNPGEAAIGIIIKQEQKEDIKLGKKIGIATNNVAEYAAVIEALNYVENNYETCEVESQFVLDSELVVKQINKIYKIKDEKLRSMYEEIQAKLKKLKKYTFTHVLREKNKEADALVNAALDGKM